MGEYYIHFKIYGRTDDGDNVYAEVDAEIEGGAVKMKQREEILQVGLAGKLTKPPVINFQGLEKIAVKGIEAELIESLEENKQEQSGKKMSVEEKERLYELIRKGYTNEQIREEIPHLKDSQIRGHKATVSRRKKK